MTPESPEPIRSLPPDIPAEAIPMLQAMGYLAPDRLQVGDSVPPLILSRLDGSGTVRVGDPDALRPVVLIFGSYT